MSGLLASGAIVPVAAQEKGEKAFVKARNAMIAELAQDPTARRIEPEIYDLTLVVFTDYQCPFCRQMHPRLTALAQEDRRVRIVFTDWAIFAEPSVEAARRALAAKYQGKDKAFDAALIAIKGKLSSAKTRLEAESADDEWQRLQNDLQGPTKKTEQKLT